MNLTWRRGWWRPWNWSTRTWLISIVIAAVAWPICWRWYRLWQVPDVRVPFDVQDVYRRDDTNQQNAQGEYQRVMRNFEAVKTTWLMTSIEQAIAKDKPVWDQRLDEFLIKNRGIIDDLDQVSEREWLQLVPMKSLIFYTLITPLQRMREFVLLLESESLRCQHAGQLERAWSMYPIMLRIARHAEMQGFGMARLNAASYRGTASDGISHWASNSSLAAEQIRHARKEFESLVDNRMPASEVLKVEYAMLLNTQTHPNFPDEMLPQWVVQITDKSGLGALKRGFLWLNGQPEVAVRLAKQVTANNFQLLDLPRRQIRVAFQQEKLVIFELASDAKLEWGQMSSVQLTNLLKSDLGKVYLQWDVFPQTSFYRTGCHRESARIAATRIALAAQEYQRMHGEFPVSVGQLVPDFLDQIPEDPFAEITQPLKYRREAIDRAIVWSIGENGVDDGGQLDSVSPTEPFKDLGHRITLTLQKETVEEKKE